VFESGMALGFVTGRVPNGCSDHNPSFSVHDRAALEADDGLGAFREFGVVRDQHQGGPLSASARTGCPMTTRLSPRRGCRSAHRNRILGRLSECACQGNALLFATGELDRVMRKPLARPTRSSRAPALARTCPCPRNSRAPSRSQSPSAWGSVGMFERRSRPFHCGRARGRPRPGRQEKRRRAAPRLPSADRVRRTTR